MASLSPLRVLFIEQQSANILRKLCKNPPKRNLRQWSLDWLSAMRCHIESVRGLTPDERKAFYGRIDEHERRVKAGELDLQLRVAWTQSCYELLTRLNPDEPKPEILTDELHDEINRASSRQPSAKAIDSICDRVTSNHIEVMQRFDNLDRDVDLLPTNFTEQVQAVIKEELALMSSSVPHPAKADNRSIDNDNTTRGDWDELAERNTDLVELAPCGIGKSVQPRMVDALKALFESQAFDEKSRIRKADIAIKASREKRSLYTGALAALVKLGVLNRATGRNGGYWLSNNGRELAEREWTANPASCRATAIA